MRSFNAVESTEDRTAMSIGYRKTREFIGDVSVDQLGEIISSALISASRKKACRGWARYMQGQNHKGRAAKWDPIGKRLQSNK